MLTKEQLDNVWKDQGMKYRMRRFHAYLTDRGLMPYINVNKFSSHVYELLHQFLVLDLTETKDGKQQYPPET